MTRAPSGTTSVFQSMMEAGHAGDKDAAAFMLQQRVAVCLAHAGEGPAGQHKETEAATVRMIFQRYAKIGSATLLAKELASNDVRTKRGRLMDKGELYQILRNKTYIGLAVHKGTEYPGEHQAIIEQPLWDKVHSILQVSQRTRACQTVARSPALLKGLIFAPDGRAMSPTHTRRKGRLYRYYVSQSVLKQGADACPVARVNAGDVEAVVIDQVRNLLRSPEIVVGTWQRARQQDPSLAEAEVRDALQRFDELWDEFFPAELARIVQLLVQRVEVGLDGVDVSLRLGGLSTLVDRVAEAAGNGGGVAHDTQRR